MINKKNLFISCLTVLILLMSSFAVKSEVTEQNNVSSNEDKSLEAVENQVRDILRDVVPYRFSGDEYGYDYHNDQLSIQQSESVDSSAATQMQQRPAQESEQSVNRRIRNFTPTEVQVIEDLLKKYRCVLYVENNPERVSCAFNNLTQLLRHLTWLRLNKAKRFKGDGKILSEFIDKVGTETAVATIQTIMASKNTISN